MIEVIPTPRRTYRIAHDGNSIVAGSYLTQQSDRYSDLLQARLGSRFTNFNSAYPGLPTYNPDTPSYSVIGRYTWADHPGGTGVFQALPVISIAMGWEITNEIRGFAGMTVDTALGHWADYIALLRATGYSVVYSFTTLPTTTLHATAAQMQMILQANEHLRLNPGKVYGDRILDPARLPQLSDPTSLNYYQADQLHLNSAGHVVMADLIYGALLADHLV